jgi:hypothetical protein
MNAISEANHQKRLDICRKLEELRPEVEVIYGKYVEKIVTYSASVIQGKVVISRDTRNIYIKSCPEKLARTLYLTNEEAKYAINKFLEEADKKALNIANKLINIEQELEFYSSYVMNGDTYGIHEDYRSINFKIDRFDFEYDLDSLYSNINK